MIIAVCVDDRGGMGFHHRRQSRDRAQRADLLARCRGRLWMDGGSAPLFAGEEDRIRVDGAFLEKAGQGEVCFVERPPLSPFEKGIEGVLLYRWNRVYPADEWFDLDLEGLGFCLRKRGEFPGFSHPRITRDCYERRTT